MRLVDEVKSSSAERERKDPVGMARFLAAQHNTPFARRGIRHAENVATAAALRRHYQAEATFREIPLKRVEEAAYPPILRIILNMRCRFPCGVETLCHREGIPEPAAVGDLSDKDLEAIDLVRTSMSLSTAKLIGAETTPMHRFCSVAKHVKRVGFTDITTTCAAPVARRAMAAMVDAGVDRITASAHRFNADTEADLNAVVAEGRRHNLPPVKVNWVLTKENLAELRPFIDWLGENQTTARLFSLIWTPENSGLAESIHWTDVVDQFVDSVVSVRVVDYLLSCRRKYVAKLKSGAVLDLSVPLMLVHEESSLPSVCAPCDYKDRCQEGLLGCGVRLGPDGALYSCLLRPDLVLS